MRRLLLLMLMLIVINVDAVNYYVKNGGSDSNSGLSDVQAFETISHAISVATSAGDTMFVNAGDSFYESNTISASGSFGNQIVITRYGTGVNPIISGFTTVTSWTNLGGNIWESTNAISTLSTCNMVTINGVNTPKGTYPNPNETTSYLPISSSSANNTLTSNSLSSATDWTGADAVIRSSRWTINIATITSQSNNAITFSPATNYTIQTNEGFFIQNDIRTLDVQNEWYYNPTTKKISIYSTTEPTNVKVASIDYLLIFSGSYITVDGIDFTGASNTAVYSSTLRHGIEIKNCHFSYNGISAIRVISDPLIILDNTITETNQMAMYVSGSKNGQILRNEISNNAKFKGMAQNMGSYAALACNANDILIQYNKIVNCGGIAINYFGDSIVIRNNFIDTYCYNQDDGGGISEGANISTRTKVIDNIVLNGIGAPDGSGGAPGTGQANGIYLDDNTQNMEVYGNTVANCVDNGIYLHNARNNNVYDNLIYNCGTSQFRMADDLTGGVVENNTVTNNIFFAKESTQYVMSHATADGATDNPDVFSFATYDSNYYCRPIALNQIIRIGDPSYNYMKFSFEEWQAYTGQDANSFTSPVIVSTSDSIRFVYNETASDSIITLDYPSIAIGGTTHYSSITLAPYTSAVLLPYANQTAPETPISSGQIYRWKNMYFRNSKN